MIIPGLPHHLITTTALVQYREAAPIGQQFMWHGRFYEIDQVHGIDPAAPVILRQMHDSKHALAGQLVLHSLASVEAMMESRVARVGLTGPGGLKG